MDVIRALCKKQEDALILLDQVTKKTLLDPHRPIAESVMYNTSPAERGTSREYTVARLERDGRPDLAQRVVNRLLAEDIAPVSPNGTNQHSGGFDMSNPQTQGGN